MIFRESAVDGAFLVEAEPVQDERGSFARTFCTREFAERGLVAAFAQAGTSTNVLRGTLRGLHYQVGPVSDAKLVRCVAGAIFDVVLDLRRGSPTFERHCTHLLRALEPKLIYVPDGCAHGFLTLADASEVHYLLSAPHSPEHERRVRWNDPRFGIRWPEEPRVISKPDADCPDFAG